MSQSTVTIKGQTTVPQPIRDALHAQPGTRLTWNLMPDGAVIVRAKTRSVLDLAGTLQAPSGKEVSIEQMNPWR
ncbi:type II toxin-antitoxin system PrlF family antitoxin [Rhodoferax sp. 4810]|nr:type II toxin-antitoxin system PrlF family antitoxin [Rhodoferax jenense]